MGSRRRAACRSGSCRLPATRTPRSSPGSRRCKAAFRRASRTCYRLDVDQLRSAFVGGNELADHIRRFRTERVALIEAGETPIPLHPEHGKIVVHLVPYEAFGPPPSLELNATEGSGLFHPPFERGASSTRWNLDGLITYDRPRADEPACAYAQLFRTGIYEGVEGWQLRDSTPHPLHGAPILYGGWIEADLNRGLANPLQVLSRIGVQPPIVVLVSLLGMKGRLLLAGDGFFPGGHSFDRDPILLPEQLLDSYPVSAREELPLLLRPLIDSFWQAGGWPHSPLYDAAGNWEGNKR